MAVNRPIKNRKVGKRSTIFSYANGRKIKATAKGKKSSGGAGG